MGIEPTPRTATARGNGFEDRESHQAPGASVVSLARSCGHFRPLAALQNAAAREIDRRPVCLLGFASLVGL